MKPRRTIRTVLFSLGLSSLLLAGSSRGPGSGRESTGTPEPGGPLDATASLVSVVDAGGSPLALVRISLTSPETDAEATIVAADNDSGRGTGKTLARTWLQKGRRGTVQVASDLSPGQENHLYYKIGARGTGGSITEATVYLRVNLDDTLEGQVAGEYIQYLGGVGTEVEP